MHQRGAQLHALLVAQRELLDARAGAVGQAQAVDPGGGLLAGGGGVQAVQLGHVGQLVAHAHLGVQAALLGHVAERAAGVRRDRLAVPGGRAGVGLQDAEHDAHGRGLARPVGADEAVQLTAGDLEAQVVQGDHVAEAPAQSVQGQHSGLPPRLERELHAQLELAGDGAPGG